MRVRVVLVTVVAIALAAALAWWFLHDRRSAYQDALATLPAATLRASYTDWEFARTTVDARRLRRFVERAYDADISRTSALENTAIQLDERYGISLRDAQWEAYGQSDEGSVAVLRVADSTSYPQLRETLRGLGYGEPRSETAAWAGDETLLARIDPTLTPVMENLVLLEDEHLVLFSDSAGYAEDAADVAAGSASSLLSSVTELAGVPEKPVSAILWAKDFACEDLSMGEADATDQTAAEELVRAAGGVTPLAGLLMARDGAGAVTVAMAFENDGQAGENLQPRTDLASGDAPGLGRSFPERFEVVSGETDGRLVVLRLRPQPDQDALLSAISDGPVLFATC